MYLTRNTFKHEVAWIVDQSQLFLRLALLVYYLFRRLTALVVFFAWKEDEADFDASSGLCGGLFNARKGLKCLLVEARLLATASNYNYVLARN